LLVVALAVGGLLWSATLGHTVSAPRPQLFGGYVVLEDDAHPLPVVNLATGNVTVRLQGVDSQVNANRYQDVQAVPLDSGTMLVNKKDGTFNLLGKDNYVLDTAGSGVGLGQLSGQTGAAGFAAGPDAYIVRYAPRGTTVSLVDQATVQTGAKLEVGPHRAPAVTTPRGFADLGGPVGQQAGSVVVADGDLWALVSPTPQQCQVDQLHPVPTGHNGLLVTPRATLPGACDHMAINEEAGMVAIALPGHFRIFPVGSTGVGTDVTTSTSTATGFLPVTGNSSDVWFLARTGTGWSDLGVSPVGRVAGPARLDQLTVGSDPIAPVVSNGVMYTLDKAQRGEPTLWTIIPGNGAMISVTGQPTYPALATERPDFSRAQVLVDGPRVVFNNPGSLEAVVVFTDGSHPPVVINKTAAVELSAVGPAQIANAQSKSSPGQGQSGKSSSQPKSVPVVQAVSQSVTCANTTQKPYAPQITSITPSSGSALVAWSYQLLDLTDCEPDSWSVHMTAVTGSHQPDQPTQVVNGQDQLQFTGLRPATTYQVVVTAYINAQSTPSAPATFTTTPRGPDAPTSVRATVDSKGAWVVSWTPCTSPKCVVPADVWNVVGSACGGSYVPQPPTVQVAGNVYTTTINADGLGLLGDSLAFSVNGQLASGLAGNPTSDAACTQSWRSPIPADISLAHSGSESGQSITATLQVQTTSSVSPVEALGSNATNYVFHMNAVSVSSTSPTVTIPGLTAGITYTPAVTIYPAGHPQAAVTITGTVFDLTLKWPETLGATASFAVDPSNPNLGTATINISGMAQLVQGQQYSSSGTYQCGSFQGPLPSEVKGIISLSGLSLDSYGGPCSVSFDISDGTPHNPYGNVPSTPPLTTSFDMTAPLPNYSLNAAFGQSCQVFGLLCVQQVTVTVDPSNESFAAGDSWMISTNNDLPPGYQGPDGDWYDGQCDIAPTSVDPSKFDGSGDTFALPNGCGNAPNNPHDVEVTTVTVTYRYLGQTQTALQKTPSGSPATTTTTTTSTTVPSSTTGAPKAGGASPHTALALTRTKAATGAAASRQTFAVTLGLAAVALFAGTIRPASYRRRRREQSKEVS
jgi:hypothetical protein